MNSAKISDMENSVYNLRKAFYDLIVKIYTHAYYHERRALFFRRWNLMLQIFDWIIGLGAAFVGIYLASEGGKDYYLKISIGVAIVAILALFLSILFDLSQKAEKHRWLTYSYESLKKEIALIRFVKQINKRKDKYEENIKIFYKVQCEISKLIKEERPMLKFLALVSNYTALQELSSQTLYAQGKDDDDGSVEDYINIVNKEAIANAIHAISRINCFRNFFINALSLPLGAMKFEQKMRDELNEDANKTSEGNES